MTSAINVHMLPELAHPHAMAGKTVVVVDVLRATTTIAAAIRSGACAVLPCLEVEEARNLAKQHRDSGTPTLLAGERGGLPITGFDLGNSPSEYDSKVNGQLIVFTTTNGTKAMMRCVGAARVLTGAFVNLSATWNSINHAANATLELEIVCAGTDGQITREDVLFAGAIVERAVLSDETCKLNDQAQLALDAWKSLQILSGQDLTGDKKSASATILCESLENTQGGRNLIAINHAEDIRTAAEIDTIDVAAELDMSTWQIRAIRENL